MSGTKEKRSANEICWTPFMLPTIRLPRFFVIKGFAGDRGCFSSFDGGKM